MLGDQRTIDEIAQGLLEEAMEEAKLDAERCALAAREAGGSEGEDEDVDEGEDEGEGVAVGEGVAAAKGKGKGVTVAKEVELGKGKRAVKNGASVAHAATGPSAPAADVARASSTSRRVISTLLPPGDKC